MKIRATPRTLDPTRLKKVVSKEKIQSEIIKMASRLNQRFCNETIVIIGILNGAFMFLSDLSRHLSMPNVVDFVAFSSYQNYEALNKASHDKDLKYDVSGEHVVIIEDMVDSGDTMHTFLEILKSRNPKSVSICLVTGFTSNLREEYVYMREMTEYLVEHPEGYVVGYGFDDDEYLRGAEDLYVVKEEKLGEL